MRVVLNWHRVQDGSGHRRAGIFDPPIDEYIQVMEFMIRKTPALDNKELALPEFSGRS